MIFLANLRREKMCCSVFSELNFVLSNLLSSNSFKDSLGWSSERCRRYRTLQKLLKRIKMNLKSSGPKNSHFRWPSLAEDLYIKFQTKFPNTNFKLIWILLIFTREKEFKTTERWRFDHSKEQSLQYKNIIVLTPI